jgi:hypothetical protein
MVKSLTKTVSGTQKESASLTDHFAKKDFIHADVLGVGGDYVASLTGSGLVVVKGKLACREADGRTMGCVSGSDLDTFHDKLDSDDIDTSSKILSVVGDETGSGLLVFNTNPTFEGIRVNGTSTIQGGLSVSGGCISVDGSCIGTSTQSLNYTGPNPGSVSRTITEKLSDEISVKDFGAKGDGTTDDTQAIQAAIDTATSSAVSLFVPAGTYSVRGLQLPDTVCANIRGAGVDVTKFRSHSATTSIIMKRNFYSFGCSLSDFTIDARNIAQHGLQLQRGKQWQVNRISILDAANTAALFGDPTGTGARWYEAHVSNIFIEFRSSTFAVGNTPEYGMQLISSATDSNYSDIVVKNARVAGVRNEGGNNTLYSLHIYGFPFEYSPQYGLSDDGGSNRYFGFFSDNAVEFGAYLAGENSILNASQFFWTSTTEFPSAGIAYVDSSASNIQITNSTCKNMNPAAAPVVFESDSSALRNYEVVGCTSTTTQAMNGNLAIGTTTARSQLELFGTAPVLTLTDNRNGTFSTGTPMASIDFRSEDNSSSLTGEVRSRIASLFGNSFGAASSLAFYTNDSGALRESMRIDNRGNVGIGTTSPSTKLSVSGNGYVTGGLGVGVVNTSTGTLMTSGIAAISGVSFGTANLTVRATDAVDALAIQGTSTNLLNLLDNSNNPILVAKSSGRIGIGTTSPLAQLHIEGPADATTTGIRLYSTTGVNERLLIGPSGNTSAVFRSLADGIISFRSMDDSYRLLMRGNSTGTNMVSIGTSSAFARLGIYGGGTTTGSLFELANAASTTVVKVLENGNVGIGTVSPVVSFDVRGITSSPPAALTANANGAVHVGAQDSQNRLSIGVMGGSEAYSWIQSRFYGANGGTSTVALNPLGGSVAVGTTTPTAQLTTTGTVRFSNFGAGTLQTDALGNLSVASDERLKDIEGQFTRGLDAILGIDPITYRWATSTGYDTVHVYTGFSAQNIQDFIPEAVGENNEGLLSLSDRPVIATIINALKEMRQKFVSERIETKDIQTQRLCVEDICVTRDQLHDLLEERGTIPSPQEPQDQPVMGSSTVENSDDTPLGTQSSNPEDLEGTPSVELSTTTPEI